MCANPVDCTVGMMTTIAEAVLEQVRRHPDKAAVQVDGVCASYSTLWSLAERHARVLRDCNVVPGDRVGLMLQNSIDSVAILLVASMLHISIVPINIRLKAAEVRSLIGRSQVKILLTQGAIPGVVDFEQLLREAFPDLPSKAWRDVYVASAPALRAIVTLREPARSSSLAFLGKLPALSQRYHPWAKEAVPLIIMYTSGTTSTPKGCMIPEFALLANASAMTDRLSLDERDRWWCPLPMFHIAGVLFPVIMLLIGGTYISTVHFDEKASLELILQTHPTVLFPVFPNITSRLIESDLFRSINKEQIKAVCCVAPQDFLRRVQRAFNPAVLISAFGMTEATGAVTYGQPEGTEEERLGTCGPALSDWDISIRCPETQSVRPIGEAGEICVKGPALFSGYLDEPEATALCFTADGFFKTGDAGIIRQDGMLRFVGRLKDQVRVGGENVAALEVEAFLLGHPDVKIAQVVGVSDDYYGEVVAAFVELHDGCVFDEKGIQDFCQGKIARFKIPRYIRLVTEWPMSATKVQKYRLKSLIEDELGASNAPASSNVTLSAKRLIKKE